MRFADLTTMEQGVMNLCYGDVSPEDVDNLDGEHCNWSPTSKSHGGIVTSLVNKKLLTTEDTGGSVNSYFLTSKGALVMTTKFKG